MKFDLSLDEMRNRFTLTTHGLLSLKGIELMMRDLLTHEKWQKGRDLLVDHRDASFKEISLDDMNRLAAAVVSLDQTLGAHRCAVVSPEDGYFKHASYEYEVTPRVELVTRSFRASEFDAAVKWIENT